MYPIPEFNILTVLIPAPIDALNTGLRTAVLIPDGGAVTVSVGVDEYPVPAAPTTTFCIPKVVEIEQVAAAPAPPPPEIVIVGASVYPAPALVISSLRTEVTFAL